MPPQLYPPQQLSAFHHPPPPHLHPLMASSAWGAGDCFAPASSPSSLSSAAPSSPSMFTHSTPPHMRASRKRNRHEMAEVSDMSSSSSSLPPPTLCKLPARTLLYQLQLGRPEQRQQQTPSLPTAADSDAGMDVEEEGGSVEGASSSPTPSTLSCPSSSFPSAEDSLVSLFLTPAAAQARYRALQADWRRKGMRAVRERIVEYQLTQPVQLLFVTHEEQKRAWIDPPPIAAPAANSSNQGGDQMEDEESAVVAPMRASPFERPVLGQHSQRTPSISSSSAAASSSSSSAASATPVLPTLSPSPTLQRLLESSSDTLSGYCVSRILSSSSSPSSSFDPPPSLSESTVVDGELLLRSGVCTSLLHLLDDDKKGGLNQQLLTDLFGRASAPRR